MPENPKVCVMTCFKVKIFPIREAKRPRATFNKEDVAQKSTSGLLRAGEELGEWHQVTVQSWGCCSAVVKTLGSILALKKHVKTVTLGVLVIL